MSGTLDAIMRRNNHAAVVRQKVWSIHNEAMDLYMHCEVVWVKAALRIIELCDQILADDES